MEAERVTRRALLGFGSDDDDVTDAGERVAQKEHSARVHAVAVGA